MTELEELRTFYADVKKVIELNRARVNEMTAKLISESDMPQYDWFELYGKKEALREVVSQLNFCVSTTNIKELEGGEKK